MLLRVADAGLLTRKTVGIDRPTLEANAAPVVMLDRAVMGERLRRESEPRRTRDARRRPGVHGQQGKTTPVHGHPTISMVPGNCSAARFRIQGTPSPSMTLRRRVEAAPWRLALDALREGGQLGVGVAAGRGLDGGAVADGPGVAGWAALPGRALRPSRR